MRRSRLKRSPLPPGVTPLARGAELQRSKGLARGKLSHPSGTLAPRSPARAKLYRLERAPAVAEAVAADRPCEVGGIMAAAGINRSADGNLFTPCHLRPSRGHPGWGMHERRKRSAGGSLVNPANLLWSCGICNDLVEDRPEMVRLATGTALVVREGDPEWESLGRRADR